MNNHALLAASAMLLALAACSAESGNPASETAEASTPDNDADTALAAASDDEALGDEEGVEGDSEQLADAADPAPEPSATPKPTASPTAAVAAAAAPATVTKVAASTVPEIFEQRCAACHTATRGGEDMLGPNLYGTYGRKMGEGSFDFSDAVKNSGLTMDEATLHAWLESPRKLVPGNRMSFPGLKDAAKRQEIIDYLKQQS